VSAKATPGPWEAVLKDDSRGQPVCYYRGLIALVESRLSVVLGPGHAYDTVPEEQWEPNAKLIAAAPDLADALTYFVRMFGETPDGEWPVQIAEDPSTMTATLAAARSSLRKAGRLP
jgi:hypothetical protein